MSTRVTFRNGPNPGGRVGISRGQEQNRGGTVVRTRAVTRVDVAPIARAGNASGRSSWSTVRGSAYGRENRNVIVTRK